MNRTAPILFALGAACVALFAQTATAQTYPVKQLFSFDQTQILKQANIPYADLDLASAEGTRAMLRRIETAADQVCGGTADLRSSYQRQRYNDCRSTAIQGAVRHMHNPQLEALAFDRHEARFAAR